MVSSIGPGEPMEATSPDKSTTLSPVAPNVCGSKIGSPWADLTAGARSLLMAVPTSGVIGAAGASGAGAGGSVAAGASGAGTGAVGAVSGAAGRVGTGATGTGWPVALVVSVALATAPTTMSSTNTPNAMS